MEDQHRLIEQRREKLERLEARGVAAFPHAFARTHRLAALAAAGDAAVAKSLRVRVAGRLMAVRGHGKTAFGHLADEDGRLQIYVRRDEIGDAAFELFELLDLGDLVGVEGTMMRTRTGELTVQVAALSLLAKSLRPLPDKWHGLQDIELRSRQRYLDLLMDPEVRAHFARRTRIVQNMRETLVGEGFLEVDTPILQPLYGGATARPFKTVFHALGEETVYLRIADELYLKRLIVGGYDRVFEIGKDFRNEGMDRTHNPEFTMMECYAAYWDYRDVMAFVERVFARLAAEFTQGGRIRYGEHELDLSQGFRRATFFGLLHEYTGVDLKPLSTEAVAQHARAMGIEVDLSMVKGRLLDEIFSLRVQPSLIQPIFVCDHPLELSPLAKKHRDDPQLVERFEGFLAGFEICNAFSELNDPRDQRARFAEQGELRAKGDDEAQETDEDYLRALEYGMPPTGGLGIGVDRVVMLLSDKHSIRDVLLFPHMRPEHAG
jgi:lysyl-tRNA synthetase class 2